MFVKASDDQEQVGFNINIVECKFKINDILFYSWQSFNINIVECK